MNGIGKFALGTMGMNFNNKEGSIQTIQGHTMRRWFFENGVGRMI